MTGVVRYSLYLPNKDTTMATTADPVPTGKFNFPGPIGTKRRRMRSGGNVSTATNNVPKKGSSILDDDDDDPKTAQTSKCKGATTIPIFLKSKCFQCCALVNDGGLSWCWSVWAWAPAKYHSPSFMLDYSAPRGAFKHLKDPPSYLEPPLTSSLFPSTETYKMVDTCDSKIASW